VKPSLCFRLDWQALTSYTPGVVRVEPAPLSPPSSTCYVPGLGLNIVYEPWVFLSKFPLGERGRMRGAKYSTFHTGGQTLRRTHIAGGTRPVSLASLL
jgi:hypothetical protein